MSNTYSQVHLQFVFAVQNRYSLIHEGIRERTEKYITGIVQDFAHKMLSIYCMPGHAHLLVGFRNNQSIADLMREVKAGSSKFLNTGKFFREKLNWQNGYGAFSYSKRDVPNVINYILNQPEHHRKVSFKDEYISLLKEFQIAYEEQYLFDWLSEV